MSPARLTKVRIDEIRRQQPRFQGLNPGHRACLGCGQALAARLVTEAAGPDVVIANATGCLEVFTTAWPESAWSMPWIHSLFENVAAVASGIEAAYKAKGKSSKVLAFAGDGGTFDIGFQSLSGMIERGHNVTFVCYDNEGYMNTGIQRSSSTPHAAATTTSPQGKQRTGKRHLKKDILSIIAAHHMPYAATASVAYPADLRDKTRRALAVEGPSFLLVHSPCPLGWGHDSSLTIKVARLAITTGLLPLLEFEYGELISHMPIRKVAPVEEYLRLQDRFAHLFGASWKAHEELEHLKAIADYNIRRWNLTRGSFESRDTEGADTVARGGAFWA